MTTAVAGVGSCASGGCGGGEDVDFAAAREAWRRAGAEGGDQTDALEHGTYVDAAPPMRKLDPHRSVWHPRFPWLLSAHLDQERERFFEREERRRQERANEPTRPTRPPRRSGTPPRAGLQENPRDPSDPGRPPPAHSLPAPPPKLCVATTAAGDQFALPRFSDEWLGGGGGPLGPQSVFVRGVHENTQACFQDEYGDIDDWPSAPGCCPPLPGVFECVAPGPHLLDIASAMVPDSGFAEHLEEELLGAVAGTPDYIDLEMFHSAVAVLMTNIDIVSWVACLIDEWSPESEGLAGRLENMLTTASDGSGAAQTPWHVTFMDDLPGGQGESGKAIAGGFNTVWTSFNTPDGSIGVMLNLGHTFWQSRRWYWLNRESEGKFCMAVGIASIVLHELVHLCNNEDLEYPPSLQAELPDLPAGYTEPAYEATEAQVEEARDNETRAIVGVGERGQSAGAYRDQPGARHDAHRQVWIENPDGSLTLDTRFEEEQCWDECNMIGTMFLWAMTQRYAAPSQYGPCLTQFACCSGYDDATLFAHSSKHIKGDNMTNSACDWRLT